MTLQLRRRVDDVLGELEPLGVLLPVQRMPVEESVHPDLRVAVEPLIPPKLFRVNLQQVRIAAPGPGKVAVEVHGHRNQLLLRLVISLETNERAGMGDELVLVVAQLADQEELVGNVQIKHVALD